MITICWDGHKFEYLQDQVECPQCGERPQFDERRFAPGEREKLQKISDEAKERNKQDFGAGYKRGYMEGFEKGILAEEERALKEKENRKE